MSKLKIAARLPIEQCEIRSSIEIDQSHVRTLDPIDNRHMRLGYVRQQLPINLAAADHEVFFRRRQSLEQFRNASDRLDAVDRSMRQHEIAPTVERFADRLECSSSHDHRRAERHRSEAFHVLVDSEKQSIFATEPPIPIDARDQFQAIIERTADNPNDFSAPARFDPDQIGERHLHECAPVYERMRNDQSRRFDFQIVDRENVEIDRPRAPSLSTHSTERRFDLLQSIEQRERIERRFECGCRIDIRALIDHAPRLGFIKK